jgi:hypothetical protein
MRSRTFRRLPVLALLAAAALSGGCLKRTISVTTEPPGALVWINDVEVGRTPLETDFTFYGKYDVRIRREGYEPLITSAKADTPVQELPGIDLLAEAMPVRFTNVVRWHWDLVPLAEQSQNKEQAEQALIARANDLRAQIPAKPAAEAPKADASKPDAAPPAAK